MKFWIFIMLVVLVATGCDAPRGKPMPSDPVDIVAKVEVLPSAPTQCACQGAKQIRITNVDTKRGLVPSTLYERDIQSDEISQTDETFLLNPGESKTLACSIDNTPANPSCTIQRTYAINGIQWPGPIENTTRDQVAQIVQGNLADAESDVKPHGQCKDRCVNGTGQCFKVSGGGDANLGIEIANLVSSSDLNDGIPVSKVIDLTASGQNECNRTDIALRAGKAYNYGDNCSIHGTLPPSLGTASIVVQPNFLLIINKGAGINNFDLIFSKSAGGIDVQFTDGSLNAGYGGVVRQVSYQNRMYSIEAGTGACFAVTI
jgi:hypothetical protein